MSLITSLRYAAKSAKTFLLQSDYRKTAWLLLLVFVSATIGGFYLQVQMAPLLGLVAQAFFAMNKSLLFASVLQVTGLCFLSSAFLYMQTWCIARLVVKWREWMFGQLNNKLLSGKPGKEHVFPEICSSEQHLLPAFDLNGVVGSFVSTSVSMTLGTLMSAGMLGGALVALWIMGGALSFTLIGITITIPGFLMWAAVLAAAVQIMLPRLLGSNLEAATRNQQRTETVLSRDLTEIQTNADIIAFERGERFYKERLATDMREVSNAHLKQQDAVNKNTFFTNMLQFLVTEVYPYLVAAPLYLRGLANVAALASLRNLFSQINLSLTLLANRYTMIAAYNTWVTQLKGLEKALDNSRLSDILVKEGSEGITVKDLTVTDPAGKEPILGNLSVTMEKGQHTLIVGKNGTGKSILLKVVTKTYAHGKGNISRPPGLFCCAQHPFILSNVTLRQLLAYPDKTARAFSDQEMKEALSKVGLGTERFVNNLDEASMDWNHTFSGGELEKLVFARALLHKPKWLVLDETTANLDLEAESDLYALIKQELRDTTIISVGHRPALHLFHDKVVELDKQEDGATRVREVSGNQTSGASMPLFSQRSRPSVVQTTAASSPSSVNRNPGRAAAGG